MSLYQYLLMFRIHVFRCKETMAKFGIVYRICNILTLLHTIHNQTYCYENIH